MPELLEMPPFTPVETVTDILHGVPVQDPYRWLEDGNSLRTREWLADQARFARSYLDGIPGRKRIWARLREFLAVETFDSLQKSGERYFFRKRESGQQQPCIFMREGAAGEDRRLIDPADLGRGDFIAVKPRQVSPDGRLLLYEIKEGGERSGTFALLDIAGGTTLPDVLPRGFLYGFAFSPDGRSFYYVHEPLDHTGPYYPAVCQHVLGRPFSEDRMVFRSAESRARICLLPGRSRLGILQYRFLDKTISDFYTGDFARDCAPQPIAADIDHFFVPMLGEDRIFALVDHNAPNRRIVEIRLRTTGAPRWVDVVPGCDATIDSCSIVQDRIYVAYLKDMKRRIPYFDFSGKLLGEVPVRPDETVRMIGGPPQSDELLFESESFTEPTAVFRFSPRTGGRELWSRRKSPFNSSAYTYTQVWYTSRDGTRIPMYLMGHRDVVAGGNHPVIMTSYGGYGVSMTPQFSVFVAFLVERGCLFALPNIRGGSEFGAGWHLAAKRRNRQTAYDDFLAAAEWLIETGRTKADRLAIFGGSNSGLLAGAALTQRPELFRAVVCMAPMLDMLRYHLFDNAHIWRDEFGTAEDREDFRALSAYSPYHHVRPGTAYPATMIVSGDADRNCNPLHARKMTAALQAANASGHPIILDYNQFRGHSPVLPLNERIAALTDRMAFLCDQLGLRA